MGLLVEENIIRFQRLIRYFGKFSQAISADSPTLIAQIVHEAEDIVGMIAKGGAPFTEQFSEDLGSILCQGIGSAFKHKKLSALYVNLDVIRFCVVAADPIVQLQGKACDPLCILSIRHILQTGIDAIVWSDKKLETAIGVGQTMTINTDLAAKLVEGDIAL